MAAASAFLSSPEGLLQARLVLDCYERLLGRPLIARSGDDSQDARALYEAPFAVLSHGIEADPILNYGNATALRLWETNFKQLTCTPSRLTAEPMAREARDKLMSEVVRTGFVTGYAGIRISAAGRRFRIDNVTIWNLTAPDGTFAGQAATFDRWCDVLPF